MRKPSAAWAAPLVLLFVVAGCTAPGLPAVHLAGTPSFLMGLWHGVIFPITFLISLFDRSVGVYSALNDGGWYNFGFFLGLAISMGGGAGAGARRRRRDQRP